MKGDLLAASFDNQIYRIELNAAGTQRDAKRRCSPTTSASAPLDVDRAAATTSVPGHDLGRRPSRQRIDVFEPTDFGGGRCRAPTTRRSTRTATASTTPTRSTTAPTPARPPTCRPTPTATTISDLQRLRTTTTTGCPTRPTRSRIDAANGTTHAAARSTTVGERRAAAGGLLDLGFTGLMTNGRRDYARPVRPDKMTAGGAAGVVTVDEVPAGDALEAHQHSGSTASSSASTPGRRSGRSPSTRAIVGPFAGHHAGGLPVDGPVRRHRRPGQLRQDHDRGTSTGRRSRRCPSSATARSFDAVTEPLDAARAQRRRPLPPRRPVAEHGPAQLHLDDRRDDELAPERRRPDRGARRLVHRSRPRRGGGHHLDLQRRGGPFPASWDFLQVTAENPPPPAADPGPGTIRSRRRPQPWPRRR